MPVIVLIVAAVILTFVSAGWLLSVPPYRGKAGDHFDGKVFHNIDPIRPHGFMDLLKVVFTEKRGQWDGNDRLLSAKPGETAGKDTIRVFYVNHTSFLIQAGAHNILTDPVYSHRASPVPFAGPSRKSPPGIRFEDLPAIHVVLVSHNHYDHMDIPTLRRLQERFRPVIYTPLGNKEFLSRKGLSDVIEMDWWETESHAGEVNVHCVPARHFSGRGMFDRNRALWGGFVLEYSGRKIYFAADTGYGSFIRQIARRFAPVDLSILPIGAYEPSWFVKDVHASPAEAVKMHRELRSKQSIASHFGTFPMAWEGEKQPEEDLEKSLRSSSGLPGPFYLLRNGESLTVPPRE